MSPSIFEFFEQKNIKGAIFDLDGTLVDSMGVWHRIDDEFLGRRGFPADESYKQAVKTMKYETAAHYTIERYGLSETPEEVMAEWDSMALHEYRYNIKCKPGAAEFLSELRKSLHRAISHCVTQNVDDFMDYVDRASALYKHTNFVLAYGNKAIKIPYSEELCMEIFDFLDLLDRHYLRPELYSDYESDDNDIPKSEYDEPLVERDFEG